MSEAIVEFEKVNLVFNIDIHREWSLRDVFSKTLTNFTGVFGHEKDRIHVLKDIDFKIHNGDRVGILGMNGAGKTTLCRVAARTFKPTRGKIQVNANHRAIFNTQIGIQPELTGRENAFLLAQLMYPLENDLSPLVEEALVFSELGRFVDVPYRTYSNGMQARLCLSLISAKPAELLILDEVFDGADVFFREKIAKRVTNVIHSSGAVLFVSHTMEQIRQVCNRVVVLHHGQIVCDDAPEVAIKFYQGLHETNNQSARV